MKKYGMITLFALFFCFFLWGLGLSEDFYSLNIRFFKWVLDIIKTMAVK